ncbi:uncharacterized protein IL334_006378 [Kwoniella shivajii]|uniref:FAD dependent oxidoreductase domain-containing protein n=1 Tax=Kwoniella shivajii TaxID=564305 RepID=A0ABZ1D7V6_9TREE|nr:hypothetical protein IL334_006378 [Kwoniella shivajii]
MVKYDAVILGCGVLGLSIAHELTRKGLKVAVVGKDLPEDIHSTGFASPWAGANWHSFATNESERRRDEKTFKEFARLSKEIPELCERRPYVYYWRNKGEWEEPWYKDLVFGYRLLSSSEIPSSSPFKYGVTYEAYTLNTPLYLSHLATTLREKGVPIMRNRVSSLAELYDLPAIGKVELVINASGLGSRSLIGVLDELVYPAKGQTVLIESKDVNECYGDINPVQKSRGESTYIIPRPGVDNHVILGGCYLPNDWSTNVNPQLAEDILKRCWEICPLLDDKRGTGSWEDIKIISHNIGLRPCRTGGLRCELEYVEIGNINNRKNSLIPFTKTKTKSDHDDQKTVAVIHAYGIGPAGYQSSLGISEEVGRLVDDWLSHSNRKQKSKL